MMYILGFDIGGTKCAVITATWDGDTVKILKKEKCPTDHSITPEEMLQGLIGMADRILTTKPDAIGISCGGPLDAENGIILSPPNLPGWDHVEIVKMMEEHYGVSAHLQNDANACAVAEWKFGAGKGYDNVIFMTFGTGLGAGLILDGKLYGGTNGNAGEVGHIRLAKRGPVGFGKAGSFEGFCSGGGIAQLGWQMALAQAEKGNAPLYYREGMTPHDVTAKTIADAALAGDEAAKEVYRLSGAYLGKGISILIDVLNPDVIVIGSIFTRSRDLLWDAMQAEIEREVLPFSAAACRIVAAKLGEEIGDYAAIATALL